MWMIVRSVEIGGVGALFGRPAMHRQGVWKCFVSPQSAMRTRLPDEQQAQCHGVHVETLENSNVFSVELKKAC